MTIFNPTGSLNVSADASDLKDNDFVRCKNLRIDQQGLVKTRDGSTKLNASAINTDVWHIEEQAGVRYVFAGTDIYKDEISIVSDLTSAQWSAIQYSAFNDPTKNIFALNGTDRKRIEAGVVYEWGIEPPTDAPVLTVGTGEGLTGIYNARYTYVRKVGDLIVSESDPSPVAAEPITLNDQSLSVAVTQSTDSQVTHLRLYKTLANGEIYYLDHEVAIALTYAYGYVHTWESEEDAGTGANYIEGLGFKFTFTDATHTTENTATWEELFKTIDAEHLDRTGSVRDLSGLHGERARFDWEMP